MEIQEKQKFEIHCGQKLTEIKHSQAISSISLTGTVYDYTFPALFNASDIGVNISQEIKNYIKKPVAGRMLGVVCKDRDPLPYVLDKVTMPYETMLVKINPSASVTTQELLEDIYFSALSVRNLVITDASNIIDLARYGDSIYNQLRGRGIGIILCSTDFDHLWLASNKILFHKIRILNIDRGGIKE